MRLPLLGRKVKQVEPALVADLGRRLADDGLEVAAVAVGLAHALGVLFELAGVEGAGEQVLEKDGVRNADRPQVLHRSGAGCGC